ncbi:MAG: hypothetical protein PVJ52_00510 [Candidatus Woesebacteria bacterium]|jgi:hypothetical protein
MSIKKEQKNKLTRREFLESALFTAGGLALKPLQDAIETDIEPTPDSKAHTQPQARESDLIWSDYHIARTNNPNNPNEVVIYFLNSELDSELAYGIDTSARENAALYFNNFRLNNDGSKPFSQDSLYLLFNEQNRVEVEVNGQKVDGFLVNINDEYTNNSDHVFTLELNLGNHAVVLKEQELAQQIVTFLKPTKKTTVEPESINKEGLPQNNKSVGNIKNYVVDKYHDIRPIPELVLSAITAGYLTRKQKSKDRLKAELRDFNFSNYSMENRLLLVRNLYRRNRTTSSTDKLIIDNEISSLLAQPNFRGEDVGSQHRGVHAAEKLRGTQDPSQLHKTPYTEEAANIQLALTTLIRDRTKVPIKETGDNYRKRFTRLLKQARVPTKSIIQIMETVDDPVQDGDISENYRFIVDNQVSDTKFRRNK